MSSTYSIHRLVAGAVVLLVLVLFVSMALVATTAAQEQTPANATATPDERMTPEEEIAEQLGDLVIHSYEYDDGADDEPGAFTMELTWTGRAPEQVTLTEMIELDSGGSTQISFQQQRLRPDERTEITMDAEIRSGGTAAIMVTTTESVENGEAVVLQDGDPRERPAIHFQNVILAVGLSSTLTAAGAFVFVLRRKHSEEYGKEKIA